MNSQESKRRTVLCLALYLLFAFIPGLHAALHPLLVESPDLVGAGCPTEISSTCPDDCENPQHRHLAGTDDCPVCKTGWSPSAIPHLEDRGLPATYASEPLARGAGFALRAPDIRIEHARAPPENLL